MSDALPPRSEPGRGNPVEPASAGPPDDAAAAAPDDAAAAAPKGEPLADQPTSVDRRSFFRVFSRQTVTTVAQVAGMAGAVQRGTTTAVVNAVGIGLGNPSRSAARLSMPEPEAAEEPAAPGAAGAIRFRSPYRLVDGTLYLLDQRLLPDATEEIACRRAADVAFQMRMLAVNGAPLLGQLAAYGFALTAAESRDWSVSRRQAELRRATQLLTYARPTARPVRAALARMEARVTEVLAELADETGGARGGRDAPDGEVIAIALMTEADAIATQAAIDHAAIARATAELLRPANGAMLRVLLIGDPGLMTTGQVGTGVPALQLLAQSDVTLKVFVAEGRPRLEGARLAAWELRLAGIDHTIVGDSALGWLMATEPLDAVLMGADWIAADGDLVGTIGSRTAAELAALGLNGGGPTPVYVLAPSVTVAPEPFAAGAVPVEMRPGRELATDHGTAVSQGTDAVNPAVEVVPNHRVSAFVTERGVHRAPFAASLSSLVRSAA